jgi:segregation and condensation protein A
MVENTVGTGDLEGALQVSLPAFEGPLDLLLYLIKKNRLNIYDIPIARITEDYLRSLEQMRSLNLETAGQFLEMAATLAYIKSRLLIPRPEDDEDDCEEDPRLKVVRPLLIYAAIQQAARFLRKCPLLGVDQFRYNQTKELVNEVLGELPPEPRLIEADLYELLRAYWRLRKRSAQLQSYQITEERLLVTDRIQELLVSLKNTGQRRFLDLCRQTGERRLLVVTFLALLEMIRSRVVQAWQEPHGGHLWIGLVGADGS